MLKEGAEKEGNFKAEITAPVTTLPSMEEGRNSRSDKAH